MELDNEEIELQKLVYYWDTIFYEPKGVKQLMRVFIGGKSSSQLQSFHDAVNKLKFGSVNVQFIDTDTETTCFHSIKFLMTPLLSLL